MLLFSAIPSIYLHRDAHYLAKRKVYIFNLMIPLCGSWAGFGEILIWGFLGVSFCKYYSFNKTSRRGGARWTPWLRLSLQASFWTSSFWLALMKFFLLRVPFSCSWQYNFQGTRITLLLRHKHTLNIYGRQFRVIRDVIFVIFIYVLYLVIQFFTYLFPECVSPSVAKFLNRQAPAAFAYAMTFRF